jgi:hypothetical protein
LRPFVPFFRNPHLSTIAANFWRRQLDEERFPVKAVLFRTEPEVQILAHSQRPPGTPRGEVLLLHGLEGSSQGGYMRSMAQAALDSGYAVTRLNMRTCGGTEALCPTLYHAGLTSDLREILRQLEAQGRTPVFLVGYSLGGNVVLKLAGELGEQALGLLSGVAAVSTPIDLAACCRRMAERENWIYESRFLVRLKQRYRMRALTMPDRYPANGLERIGSVFEFDDKFTARAFGFGNADGYYGTQSSNRFLDLIRVPALLVQSKDDPLIPFAEVYRPELFRNPLLELLAVDHGGHVGFIARRRPRFWVDGTLVEWIERQRRNKTEAAVVS